MFDIGWSEMAIILVVALVVVGPKDLPRLARTLGQWMAKGRSMAREFQRHIDDMAREAELQDLKDSVQKISPQGIRNQISKAVDPDGTLGKALDTREIAKSFAVPPPTTSPPTPPTPTATSAPAATAVSVQDGIPAAAQVVGVTDPAPASAVAQPAPAPVEKA